jgi:hypothetical protein
MDEIVYCMGKPLTSYNKEELIQIVIRLGRMLQSQTEQSVRGARMVSSLAKYYEGRDAC